MLRLWLIFLLSTLSTVVSKHACEAYLSNEIDGKTLQVDNNIIEHEKSQTTFTSYVPQCWSYKNFVPLARDNHFKSHFNVIITREGQHKVEYEKGETCGIVIIVCLLPISNKLVNDPHVEIDTCAAKTVTTFNISSDAAECIPAVQCHEKALYDTKIILTLSENDYRPLSVFSLSAEEVQYNGAALAEGRRTQALLTEHDVREYREHADALHYTSNVNSLQDEYDNMAGIDKSEFKCLEIQAWRSGPGGAPAANLPMCPTVFLRYGYNPFLIPYQIAYCDSDMGLISCGFLTSNPASSWSLLQAVGYIYDAFVADSHLKYHLKHVWNNILASLYQAKYSIDNYWLYDQMTEAKNTLQVLRSDITFGDLSYRQRTHIIIGLLNVDNDSSYLADLYKRYYSNERVHYVLEELVSMYLNRRVDPLPLMARVFSAERGNWFNITQFAQAISLHRRLSYDKDLNTFPRSVFSVTSTPVHFKTNVSFSPGDCGTPYFRIDGILFNRTTVVSRTNSLVACLDTPNVGRSITNSTKFIYLTDVNVKDNILVNPVRVMMSEGLKFLGLANTWGHLVFHDDNKLVFETYDIQPHSSFDTVYAHFTFLKDNDEVILQVSIKGTERMKSYIELDLSQVKKIKIYYLEPDKLQSNQTNQIITRHKNSTFVLNAPDTYYLGDNIEYYPLHIMASEGFSFQGYSNTWGSLDLRYDINKLIFETDDIQPHSLFDSVYAHFSFFNYKDEVIWQVSIRGTESQKRYKELNLTEVKKVQIYSREPDKLKYSRTKEALSQNSNSTLLIQPGCGFAETVKGRFDHFQRDVEHFVNNNYLPKFVELFKQSCVPQPTW